MHALHVCTGRGFLVSASFSHAEHAVPRMRRSREQTSVGATAKTCQVRDPACTKLGVCAHAPRTKRSAPIPLAMSRWPRQLADAARSRELFSAVETANASICQHLLSSGVSVNYPRGDGSTPLCVACDYGHHKIVALLLSHPDVDVNKARKDGASPLVVACGRAHDECASLLLQREDLDVQKARRDGVTALYIAAARVRKLHFLVDRSDDSAKFGNLALDACFGSQPCGCKDSFDSGLIRY